MESYMLEKIFNKKAPLLLSIIQKKLSSATYISVLLFNNGKLINSINNNYKKWAESYNEKDMEHDNVFFEISHKKLEKTNNAICFWNSVPHTSKESLEIHKRRAKYGLHNGVTILEAIDEMYTLGINLTSHKEIEEDVFYSKVILKRKYFMQNFRNLMA